MASPNPVFQPIAFELDLLTARLKRAQDHYLSFGQTWAEYLETRPHKLDPVTEAGGVVVVRLRRLRPLPIELSIVLGELLYELRAALDNCLYAVAVLVSGQNPPPSAGRLEWPIRITSDEWKSQSKRYQDLPPLIVECLELIQPYNAKVPSWNSLAILHELARIDRHRSPHGLGLYVAERHLFVDQAVVEVVDRGAPGIVEDGAELMRLVLAEGSVLSPDNFDLDLQFEVEETQVESGPGPGGSFGRPWGPLDQRLKSLIRAVDEYTEGLLNIAADYVVQQRAASSQAQ
ncbi:hypothetical protein PTW37_16300 (plasmid) [Arthrobacter agilis]|uniref:hypothetical protein n=1 Tax=Arthrobacter agilis TaxID=37921 RepID=UPI00236539C2|nr:hypothetical protein [Arthrobacter agilis]WDF35065.1 hypothetical protein PTW37_16300 [Arthrobacter agilis]